MVTMSFNYQFTYISEQTGRHSAWSSTEMPLLLKLIKNYGGSFPFFRLNL